MRLKHLVAVLTVAGLLASGIPTTAQAAPLVIPEPPREGGLTIPNQPTLTADSWVLYDADAELILAGSSADERRPMASTTKIMTALVALKYGDLSDLVTISERAAEVGEAEVGLIPGERLRLELLVTALVVRSANDAAMAVAEHIGGSVEGFVQMMNDEAQAMGLENTYFENPHGLDGDRHYSSARDLLEMALAAMSYPEFRQMTTTTETRFPPAPDGIERVLRTTNKLLEEYPGTIGVKTGYTGRAGLVFVAGAEREERTLFSVVMGSEGHFADTRRLLDWGFESFRSVAIVSSGSYEPPQPVRVEAPEPPPEVEPEPEPEPVVVTQIRTADGDPPALSQALGWFGRVMERLAGG